MSTSMNGKLDFFGRSVAVVSAMLELPESHRLLVSQDLAHDEEFQANLHKAGRTRQPVSRSGGLTIFKVRREENSADQAASKPAGTSNAVGRCHDNACNGECGNSPPTLDHDTTGVLACNGVSLNNGEAT